VAGVTPRDDHLWAVKSSEVIGASTGGAQATCIGSGARAVVYAGSDSMHP